MKGYAGFQVNVDSKHDCIVDIYIDWHVDCTIRLIACKFKVYMVLAAS